MKSLKQAVAYAIILFLVGACCDKPHVDSNVTSMTTIEEDDTLYAKSSNLKSLIYLDTADAISLARSFNRHIRPRAGINTVPRGSAVWFDKEVVKVLYDALYGADKTKLDGIRIYFGRYDKNYVEMERQNKLTAFILLTESSNGNQGKHRDVFYFGKSKDSLIKADKHNINHGELCPDECDDELNLRGQY